MSDKSKIKRAAVEIDIYESALDMLTEVDGIYKVSTDYMYGFIKDLKRVLNILSTLQKT